MIPLFIEVPGAPYPVLPPGIHWATMDEVAARFATSPRRVWLYEGLVHAVAVLTHAGCRHLYLDGSFVTAKESPGDYDGCWNSAGVVAAKLDPILLDFTNGRAAQKRKYRGELFIAGAPKGPHGTFLEFFQVEKHTGAAKGIVGVPLGDGNGGGKRP
jgi:hypothetical protein